MTRKHFEALAAEIAIICDRSARMQAAAAVANAAGSLNARFNVARFFEACNL